MDWWQPIDAYCERLGPGFWAEPVNALTNLSFLVAAAWGARLAARTRDPAVGLLAVLAAAVGLGSFLFHTLAVRWSALADVIPIAMFIAVAFGLVMRRLVGLSAWAAAAATAVFLAVSPIAGWAAAPVMGSSAGYLGALAALLAVGRGLEATGTRGGGFLTLAGLAFSASLALRMADLPGCEGIPLGTHFGWHLLNGVVLALVMRALARA